ncbi:MAG: serine/threonine-protein kinase [Pseudomonadota bacterium]
MDSSGAKVELPREEAPVQREEPSASRLRASDVAEDAPRAIAGKRVGRYSLLFPIASGGMAQVWAAKPEGGGLARTVAIKLVRPEYASDEEYARMFIDEAMVASSIHHPNVCEIHELGRDGDLLFMVLEWVAGDSLSGLVQRGSELRPLPDAIAARIVADACAGLHAAHEAIGPDGQPLGIVHRDVSPPNILVSVHGHVKVSDFGIAKARHQLHSRTRTGEIKGKFAYIPPEQILGRGVDRRADIYAMGCVLYVATLGLRPFGSGAGALGKIVRGKFRLPRELREDYPEGLEAIIVKALATDPTKRYQTADEMRLALEQWLVTSGHVVVHGDVSRVVRERMTPERRKLVEAILSSSRAVPEALAQQLLTLATQEKTDTPTATSGLVMQPPGFREKIRSMARASDSDSTQLDPAAAAAPVAPAPRAFAAAPTSITLPPPKQKAVPLAATSATTSQTGKAPPPKPERRSVAPSAPFEPVPVAPVVRQAEPELTMWVGRLRPKTGLWVALGVAAVAAGLVGLYGVFG